MARNDFLDIFLSAKCRFFLGSTAGLITLPMVFRKPLVMADFIPLDYLPLGYPDALIIPKKIWIRNEKRLMTFNEIVKSGTGKFIETEQYEKAGLDVIGNTPEEIKAVAIEMESRLNGTWKDTEEDEKMQNRFQSIFKPRQPHGMIKTARIGAEFLRHNKELLG